MNTHVYVCGYYSSDYQRSGHILYVYLQEKDALDKMIDICTNDHYYDWLFNKDRNFANDIKNVTTYQELNEFIIINSKYYDNYEENAYLYIEKIQLN